MSASIALPLRRHRTLTDRRNDISTVDSPGNPSQLAPKILSTEPGLIEVAVEAGGITGRMEFRVPHVPVPGWLIPTLRRSAPLLLLPSNWNCQGAPAVERTAIQAAVDALWSFMSDQSSIPQWTPTRTGGVQLDWHENGIDLEIEFTPEGTNATAVFEDNQGIISDWDGTVAEHIEDLRAIFSERLLIH